MYYYKSRYYDPVLGRFTQADSVMNTANPHGMNPYMYVEGNPIKYNDPSGKNALIHMFNQIVGHMAGGLKWAAKGATGGMQWAAQGATGALKWASKGAANAGKTYSNFVYGKDHNCSTVSMCGVRNAGPGLMRGAQLALAATAPWISLLIDPAFTLGFWFSAVGYAVQQVLSIFGAPPPVLEYHNGGYVIKNNPLVGGGLGVTFGPFANTGIGATEVTIQHEIGHISQYKKYGGWGYMSRTWLSPFRAGGEWAEHNADLMAGTNAYYGNPMFVALSLMHSDNLIDAYLKWEFISLLHIPFL